MLQSAVVGLYGFSGSGKSHSLSQLSQAHPEWRCLEGSEVIETVLSEKGLTFEEFALMDKGAKAATRNAATETIQAFCGVTIVTGHCSFPAHSASTETNTATTTFDDVFTAGDGETYNVIYYLDTAPSVIFQRRNGDNISAKRTRPSFPVDVIESWIEHEKAILKEHCIRYGIHFEVVKNLSQVAAAMIEQVIQPLVKACEENFKAALRCAVEAVPSADVYLLLDGDRILCAEDTGKLFFDCIFDNNPLDKQKQIFQRYPEYTFQAFLEVAMLYEQVVSNADYGAAWHDGISVARLESLSQELHTGSINFALDCCQTSTAASVLATQTRRSDISGPALQSNHREVGRFLADRLLDEFPESLVQKADFAHVQGTTFQGNVTGGQHVLIVPLMRGGEPMSRGVHDRFPSASVFHFWNEQENL